jgi:hypothetical protein
MTAIALILAFGLLGIACCVLALIRNECVCNVQLAFLDDDLLYRGGAYDSLPSYTAMLYSPRYWHLWTKKQWIEVAT